MQKGILIKDGADVKSKDVYGGDISTAAMDIIVAGLQAKYPTMTVTVYNDQDSEFASAVVNSPFPRVI